MKRLVKQVLKTAGYDIQRVEQFPPGSHRRPIADWPSFLEDVRARGLSPTFILDIGANKGDWTRLAKGVFPKARFLLVEPQTEMREPLTRLCAEFGDVEWVEAGLGQKEGVLSQVVYPDDPGGSSFLLQRPLDSRRSGFARDARVTTVDSLLQSRHLAPPGIIKIDVQGFEIEVLRGATSVFGVTELIVAEVSLFSFMLDMPLLRDVVIFLGEQGYEVYDIAGYYRRPLDGSLGQIDLAFAKRDGVLRRSNLWR